jgi:hypothetical protein
MYQQLGFGVVNTRLKDNKILYTIKTGKERVVKTMKSLPGIRFYVIHGAMW